MQRNLEKVNHAVSVLEQFKESKSFQANPYEEIEKILTYISQLNNESKSEKTQGLRALLQTSLSDLLKKEKDNDPNVLLFDAAYYLLYICTKYWPKNKRSEDNRFLCSFTGTPIDNPIILAQMGYQYQISGNFFTRATSGALPVPHPDIADLRLTLSRRDRDYINAVGIQTNYMSKPVEPGVLTTEEIFKYIAIAGAILGGFAGFILAAGIMVVGSLAGGIAMVQLSPGLIPHTLAPNLFLHAASVSGLGIYSEDIYPLLFVLVGTGFGAALGAFTFAGISGLFYLLGQGIYNLAYGTPPQQNQDVIFSLDPQFKQKLTVAQRFFPSEKPQESKQDNQPPPLAGKPTFFDAVASPLIRNSLLPPASAARQNLPPMVAPTSPRIGGW